MNFAMLNWTTAASAVAVALGEFQIENIISIVSPGKKYHKLDQK